MNDEVITSKTPDTLEDLLIFTFCECGHLIEGKDNEHFDGKCFGLEFGGCWKACGCRNPKRANFELIFTEDELLVA